MTIGPTPTTSIQELAAALDRAPSPTVLDVRWSLATGADRAGYVAGHVPTAVFADLDLDLAGPPGPGGRHPLPEVAALQAALRRLGVRADRPVVVVEAGGPATTGAAARAWWLLRWAGHPDVRVLDGGYAAWQAAGLPVATGDVSATASDFTVRPGGMPVLDAAGAARV